MYIIGVFFVFRGVYTSGDNQDAPSPLDTQAGDTQEDPTPADDDTQKGIQKTVDKMIEIDTTVDKIQKVVAQMIIDKDIHKKADDQMANCLQDKSSESSDGKFDVSETQIDEAKKMLKDFGKTLPEGTILYKMAKTERKEFRKKFAGVFGIVLDEDKEDNASGKNKEDQGHSAGFMTKVKEDKEDNVSGANKNNKEDSVPSTSGETVHSSTSDNAFLAQVKMWAEESDAKASGCQVIDAEDCQVGVADYGDEVEDSQFMD